MSAAKSNSESQERLLFVVLTVVVSAVAFFAAQTKAATPLEAISFVTGALCVWLTVRESVWNFPIGLANVATFCVVFAQARLYADAGLQVVYFVLGLMGWYMWLYGGRERTQLRVTSAPRDELIRLLVLACISTLLLYLFLHRVGGSASFWDALTTSMSLAAQWLLNRKRLESWVVWIAVDAIYVPLYISKHLYLTAILYAVFLVMAVMGYRAWRRSQQVAAVAIGPLVGAPTP